MVGVKRVLAAVVSALCLVQCGTCTPVVVHPEAIKHHDVAIQYLNQGQCLEAEERCRLALEYGENFEHPHNCLGMIELQCRNALEKASNHFKDAIAVNPDFAEAHNNLGVTFIRRTPPVYEEACDEFRASLEIDPGYLDARENLCYCLMRRGVIEGAKGKTTQRTELFRDARSNCIRLSELNPNNFNARHHLGFMDMVDERYESSESNLKRCLEIDPENPICAYNLGRVYLLTTRCGEAIEQFVTALRVGESEIAPDARQNLGEAYALCAKEDGAIKQFLARIKRDPGNPTHHYDLGGIYEDKGLFDKAVNEWQFTIRLDATYCPAYFKLSQVANKNLESEKTIRRCQDFVSCATERNRSEPTPKWSSEVEECKQLVRKLELE
jgi:tetratricopeptide (TPR) repeat protein